MPYSSVEEVPDYVPKEKRPQWKEVWNSAYDAALKDGKTKEHAESSAFAQANGVAGPNSAKKVEVEKPEQPLADPSGAVVNKVWIVGKTVGSEGAWEFFGAFSSEDLAKAACSGPDFFMGPCALDEKLPDSSQPWPEGKYPLC